MFRKKDKTLKRNQRSLLLLVALVWAIFILIIEYVFVTIEITDFQKLASMLLGWIVIILFWYTLETAK